MKALHYLLLIVIVGGGVHGILITAPMLFNGDVRGIGEYALVTCMLAAYLYVTAVGVVSWRKPKQTRLLLWAFGLQIPWVSVPGIVYKFAVGLSATVAVITSHTGEKYSAGFNTNWNLGSSCELRLLQNAPIEVGINLVPLAAVLVMRRLNTPKAAVAQAQAAPNC